MLINKQKCITDTRKLGRVVSELAMIGKVVGSSPTQSKISDFEKKNHRNQFTSLFVLSSLFVAELFRLSKIEMNE